jgi:Icc-related predicted phosphoesterase
MKAWVFSDLHLEHNPPWPLPGIPKADVCICAGDISNKGLVMSISMLGETVSRHMPVIFVPGNHEFHGSSIIEGSRDGALRAKDYPNVHLLNRNAASVLGFRFLGATLWTDFQLFGFGVPAMYDAQNAMRDYREIKYSKHPFRRFSTHQSLAMHHQDSNFLRSSLRESSGEPTIVVTHHAPSILSVPPELLDDPLTPAYASRFEPCIMRYQPRLWVHGHIHKKSDYMIGNTRVVCNPHGYPDERGGNGYDPILVVDVGGPGLE